MRPWSSGRLGSLLCVSLSFGPLAHPTRRIPLARSKPMTRFILILSLQRDGDGFLRWHESSFHRQPEAGQNPVTNNDIGLAYIDTFDGQNGAARLVNGAFANRTYFHPMRSRTEAARVSARWLNFDRAL